MACVAHAPTFTPNFSCTVNVPPTGTSSHKTVGMCHCRNSTSARFPGHGPIDWMLVRGGGILQKSHGGPSRHKLARWIGRCCIAGQREGLTAAATEIKLLTRTASAGLLHPRRAAKHLERSAPEPNVFEAHLADSVSHNAGNGLGGMAWQHFSIRRDIESNTSPSTHAGFGIPREVIGFYVIDREHTR